MPFFRPLAVFGCAVFLAPAPSHAGDASAWTLALKHCIGAFEKLNPAKVEDLPKVEAPDWARVETGETFEAAEDIYVTVSGESETELASCTIAAKGEVADDAYIAWATEVQKMGIYGPIEEGDLNHVETIDWREPRMNIELITEGDVTWIKTYEVDKEA